MAINKELSVLSTNKDLGTNLSEARSKYEKLLQSRKDLVKDYVQISVAINKSNLTTMINTTALGEISVAEAMTLTQKLADNQKQFVTVLLKVREKSAKKAETYNDKLRIGNAGEDDRIKEAYEALKAAPFQMFTQEYLTQEAELSEFVGYELNQLINESNAMTMIEIPD